MGENPDIGLARLGVVSAACVEGTRAKRPAGPTTRAAAANRLRPRRLIARAATGPQDALRGCAFAVSATPGRRSKCCRRTARCPREECREAERTRPWRHNPHLRGSHTHCEIGALELSAPPAWGEFARRAGVCASAFRGPRRGLGRRQRMRACTGSAQGLGPAKAGQAEPRLTPGQSVPGFPPAEISPVSGNVRSAVLGHLPRIATATFLIAIAPPSSVGPIAR
jgi:hypothetical protein